MKSKIRNMIYAISTILLMAIGSTSVNAASFVFSQGGFPDGGFVTGSFTGEDKYSKNNAPLPYNDSPGSDGEIYTCGGRACQFGFSEITSFSIHFSGNELFESLNNIHGQLGLLDYDISKNLLNGISYGNCDTICLPIYNPILIYTGGSIAFTTTLNNPSIYLSTTEPISVTQVPLPGALGLFIPCLAWLGIIRRKGKELILINSEIHGSVEANGNAVRFLSYGTRRSGAVKLI